MSLGSQARYRIWPEAIAPEILVFRKGGAGWRYQLKVRCVKLSCQIEISGDEGAQSAAAPFHAEARLYWRFRQCRGIELSLVSPTENRGIS